VYICVYNQLLDYYLKGNKIQIYKRTCDFVVNVLFLVYLAFGFLFGQDMYQINNCHFSYD